MGLWPAFSIGKKLLQTKFFADLKHRDVESSRRCQSRHPSLRGVCAIHTIVYIREGGISSTSGRANRMRCRYVLLMVLWVLWSELLGDGKPEWNYIDTFNTEAACTEESQQRASRAKQNRKVLNSGPTHFTYRSVNATYMLSYICVPDSVDPRPK